MTPTGTPSPRDPPAVSAAVLLFVVMGLVLLLGVPLQGRDLVTGVLVTEWGCVALPVLLFVWLTRLPPGAALALRRPRPAALAGSIMAGASAWILVGVLVEVLQERILPMPGELAEQMQRMLFDEQRGLFTDLLALALSPAICEELLFRGVLLGISLRSVGAFAAVLLNGLLFGLFHMSAYRFFSTALLGLALAVIVLRSGSILPAMVFHLLNNTCTLLAGRLAGGAKKGVSWISLPVVLAAASLLVAGMVLATRRPRREADEARPESADPQRWRG